MNPAPDYSAAYVILRTDRPDLEGHGLTFTIGRGNEVVVAAARALCALVVGTTLESIAADMRGFWHAITGDSQLRWIGPDKGAMHLATAAVVNAVWDRYAKAEGKPLWKLLVDMTPEQLVACVDFRYLTDAITPGDAVDLLRRHAPSVAARLARMAATAEGELPPETAAHFLRAQRKVEQTDRTGRRALAEYDKWLDELKQAL